MAKAQITPDIYWEQGQLIGPQHFDSLTNFLLDVNNSKANLTPHPWGVYRLEYKILKDLLDIRDFYLVMPNGQILCTENSYIEGKYKLPDANELRKESITICLAVCPLPLSENYRDVTVKKWRLECVEQEDLKNNRLFLPAVQLMRVKSATDHYSWRINEKFIPPTFRIEKDCYLDQIAHKIIDQTKESIANFPEMQEARAHIKFTALYQSLAKMTPFLGEWEFSPYDLYLRWLDALALLRSCLEITQKIELEFPNYEHYNLSDTFGKLYTHTQDCLERIVLSKYREREFIRKPSRNRFIVNIPPSTEYYILAIADSAQRDWLRKSTVGYQEEIEKLLNSRYPKFKAEETENLDITRYRDGVLHILKDEDKLLMSDREKTLVIAGHDVNMPERLVLLFPYHREAEE